jgi:hypothetical protein
MNGFASILLRMLSVSGRPVISNRALIENLHTNQDIPPDLDSTSEFWRWLPTAHIEKDRLEQVVPAFPWLHVPDVLL